MEALDKYISYIILIQLIKSAEQKKRQNVKL